MRAAHVAIFGLAGAGTLLAELLHRCGVGALHLVDPHPWREGDRVLVPHLPATAVGQPRAKSVAQWIRDRGGSAVVHAAGAGGVDAALVREIALDADVLVCTFDHELAIANHWVNRAALAAGRPALFGTLRMHRAVAGPMVMAGETACFQCWRMRRLACAEDVCAAMVDEKRRDEQLEPADAPPPAWPPLAPWSISTITAFATRFPPPWRASDSCAIRKPRRATGRPRREESARAPRRVSTS